MGQSNWANTATRATKPSKDLLQAVLARNVLYLALGCGCPCPGTDAQPRRYRNHLLAASNLQHLGNVPAKPVHSLHADSASVGQLCSISDAACWECAGLSATAPASKRRQRGSSAREL